MPSRSPRTFLSSGWACFTVLSWALAVAMVLLGRWQLIVSNRKHFDLQNFGYSLQWWAFSACALLFWGKVVRDAWRGRGAQPVAVGGEVVRSAGRAVTGRVGAVDMVAPPGRPGDEPTVYRAYAMPHSATAPARSEDDSFHGAYNDYLWQLSLADVAGAPTAGGTQAGTVDAGVHVAAPPVQVTGTRDEIDDIRSAGGQPTGQATRDS